MHWRHTVFCARPKPSLKKTTTKLVSYCPDMSLPPVPALYRWTQTSVTSQGHYLGFQDFRELGD